MKNHPARVSVFVSVLFSFLFFTSSAQAANNDPFRSGREAVNPKQSVGAGQSTGAMTYSYPIAIPPGRNGMQPPDLALTYSSDDKRQDSIFGYGWSMNLPYIERVNKLGTNNLYNQDKEHTFFKSSFSGELLPLVNTTPVGGSLLGVSQSTPPLSLLDMPEDLAALGTSPPKSSEPEASRANPMTVDAQTARGFHTWTATPAFVYHPNEWADWNAARDQAIVDAKKPIPGFPVAVEKGKPLSSSLSNTKSQTIAALGTIEKTARENYSIEVTSMNQIEGGVEVFARAWDKNGEQIGFGTDGTVEMERFRIFNPPILVLDTNGSIVRTNPKTREAFNYREDPKEALLQTLEHNFSVMKNIHSGEKIVKGKIGRTTDTYYPDAHPETTSVDGLVYQSLNTNWATIHDAVGSDASIDNTATTIFGKIEARNAAGGNWNQLARSIHLFDTSALPDTDTITSATVSYYGSSKDNDFSGNSFTFNVYSSNPASNTTLVPADYSTLGSSAYSTAISYANWSTTAYNNFALNSTGLASISKTGVTKLGGREAAYDGANVAPTWEQGKIAEVLFHTADETGTTQDPKLVVEHSAPITSLLVNGLTNPSNIATSSPYFSAVHSNASSTALATSYQIQISNSFAAFSSLYWDSGKLTLSSSTPPNQRTPNIYATTTFPIDGTAYYWRIKFWDQYDGVGEWSAGTDYFIMQVMGNYMAKVDDGSMMKYSLDSGGNWIAYDKKGWKYTFGATSNARIVDPNASSSIYRWYLEEIADPNGNKVLYRYKKDNGQVYPDYIDYTDHGGGALYELNFETCDEISPYTCPSTHAISSIYGFPIDTRLHVIDMKAQSNGLTVKKYNFSYLNKPEDDQTRTLLSSVQETGYLDDGTNTVSLSATTFSYQTSTTTWTDVTDPNSWQMAFNTSDNSNNDYGWRLFDANGDALPDWVRSNGVSSALLLNTGTKWSTSTAWTIPVSFSVNNTEQGVRIADVNGDGFMDLVAASSTKIVYINNATSTWAASSTWAFPANFSFIDTGNNDRGVQIVDVNGDGLADVLQAYYASTTATTSAVYINNSHGWTEDTGWSIPENFIADLRDPGTRLYDYNGDGLIDILRSSSSSPAVSRVYLNNGRGWDLISDTPPEVFSNGGDIGTADQAVRFADINGDGRVDMVKGLAASQRRIRIAGGNTINDTFPEDFQDTSNKNYGVNMADVNGDGQIDVMRGYYDSGTGITTRKVYLKNGNTPDLLQQVVNSRGGKTTVAYQGSAQYKDNDNNLLNSSLPLLTQTVRTLTTDSGSYLGSADRVIATTTYEYRNGYYYPDSIDHKFAGFGIVIATTTDNNVTKTYFHQGSTTDSTNGEFNDHISKAGKPYRTEVYDQSGNLFTRTINKWARADYGDGRNFVKLAQTLTQNFDGDASHRDSAASTTYSDLTGDIIALTNYGEVTGNSDGTFTDIGTDLASTTYSYAASSTLAVMSLPSRELLADQNGNTVKDTKWYYDSLASGLASSGNQTKEERLISGTSYASTTKTYNAYGNVSTSTDSLGNATAFTYDAYDLYPTTVYNPLSQTRLYSYDYSLGKPATTTEENSQTFVTVFDSLDRPTAEKQPDFASPSTLVYKTTYSYTDSTTTPSSIFRSDYLSSATTSDSYTYLDGFGRTIQTKKEADSLNGWIAKDTVYNSIGSIGKESLPYFISSSAYSSATTTSPLFATYTYDALGRVLTSANAVGTTTNAYRDWRLTVTDPLSNTKDFYKDAYGNLINVVEHPSSAATTTYAWNLLGKLTKITDASSNIRNFTYDKLGRLLNSEDLHVSGDTAYGSTTRTYNAANLTSVLTPRNDTVSYAYDALNRVTSENSATTGFTDVSYQYDTCTNGTTRLCQVSANNAATTTYVYNPVGLTSTEARKIGSLWATTSTSYFRNGSTDTLTYPDNHKVAYAYNDAGDLYRVLGLGTGTTTWNAIVESMSYGPHGKPTSIDYGNNTKTTYTYDPAKVYRLTRKYTTATSTTPGIPEQFLLLSSIFGGKKLALLDAGDILAAYPESSLGYFDANVASTTASFFEPAATTTADVSVQATTTDTVITEPNLFIDDTIASTTESATTTSQNQPLAFSEITASTTPVIDTPSASTTEDIAPAPEPAPQINLPESIKTLQSLPVKERANRKGETIAALGAIEKTQRENYSIEITEMNPIGGGVEVFARAWDKNGDPIGFGTDGTVEMERFRIFNPPLLVPDANGEVSRFDSETRQIFKLREDPKEALLQTIEHNLSVMKNIHSGEKIIPGKVGRTTDTYYPNADPESTSVDGMIYQSLNTNWPTIHDAVGSDAAIDNTATTMFGKIEARAAAGGNWNQIARSIHLFDTSALPDTDTITSATASYYGSSKDNNFSSNSFTFNVYSSNPASNTGLVPSDYSKLGGSAYSDTAISYSSWSTAAYNNFSLNATGLAAISKTGVTKLGGREATYDGANVAPTWELGKVAEVLFHTADEAGSTNDPKLVIEHTPTPTASGFLTNGLINPLNIATTTLYFSAIHQNASSTALATSYEIQIATSTGFTSFYWDSGKQTLSSSTPPNQRIPNIYATTTFPIDGTAYYWRIKFWDQYDIALDYSTTTASFTMRSPASVLQDLNYTYDANGNITQISDASGTNGAGNFTYTYDNLYRLTRASSTDAVSNWLQTYTYSDIGNLTNKSDVGNYTYAGTNYANPHAATTINGTTYSYDQAGNLTSAGTNTYTWDYANRLTDTNANGTTTHYLYDQNNQRVEQDIKIGAGATSTTKYFSKYFETSGATTTLYVFLPSGELLATIEGNGSATSTYVAHTDHLGGTNIISDKDGNSSQLVNYYPYGEIRQNEKAASFDEKRKAIGQYYDDATSLNYYNARYLSGVRGQFLSEDPVFTGDPNAQKLTNPQELNSYNYAAGNPVTKSDPTGRCPQCLIGAGGAMAGQYMYDVYNNIQGSGLSAGAFYQNLSSPETYLVRAIQGGTAGFTGVLAGGLSLSGQIAAVGAASGATGAFGNYLLGDPVSAQSVVSDALVGGLTFGVGELVPKVPGRLPKFATPSFFFGQHTQQSLAQLTVGAGTSYISTQLGNTSGGSVRLPTSSGGGISPAPALSSVQSSWFQSQINSIAAQVRSLQQQVSQLISTISKKR